MSEHWKPIPGFNGYEASDLGRVRSAKTLYVLSSHDNHGYRRVNIAGTKQLQHVLVLLAFRGHPLPGQESRHKDGKRDRNVLENLMWATKSINEKDKAIHGTGRDVRGTLNPTNKLTEDDVLLIRGSGESATMLADRFGVSKYTIFDIRSRRRWGWL